MFLQLVMRCVHEFIFIGFIENHERNSYEENLKISGLLGGMHDYILDLLL